MHGRQRNLNRMIGRGRFQLMADGLKLGAVVAVLGWLAIRATADLGYHWQWYRLPRYLLSFAEGGLTAGPLLKGLAVTLQITAAGLVLALAFGLITALMRLSGSIVARGTARAYLELIRNTPLLVQLFFIYFVLGPILEIEAFTAAVLTLSLFEGAYASEIFRAGILSIHRGQWEAAYSLGLGTWHAYQRVILPQALRVILPPLTSQAISLVKDSALVSTIAIYDLTMQGQAIVAETYLVFEVWFTIAAVYLVITLTLSFTIAAMRKRLSAANHQPPKPIFFQRRGVRTERKEEP
jgi:polar amino acid transport system permease protein